MVEQQNNVLDAALKAGAKYLVRVGGGRAVAVADSEFVVGRGHAAIEQKLRDSGIKWVILRPGLFMQNVLGQAASIKNDSKMVMSFAKDMPVALIDVRDTGAVGARILIDPAPHAGKIYEFTGKLTTYGEFAEVFSQALGRPIAYVGITPEQAEQGMKSRGMPDWLVAHLVTIAKLGASGGFSTENTTLIDDLVKRDPITTKQVSSRTTRRCSAERRMCALSPCGRGQRRTFSKHGRVRGCGGPPSPILVVEPLSSPLPQGERAR